tara:strand:+ start:6220 stop:7272 length:1053 start_codon:yes stop_codon:yes gene_type:complete
MQYTLLGRTGLAVSRLSLGTFTFSQPGGALKSVNKVDPQVGEKLVNLALDAGVNLFDTADRYANGDAEVILGKALRTRRHEAVIVTKGGLRSGDSLLESGLSKRHLMNAIDASLQRLGTDHVDVYLAHRNDEIAPLEETLVALDDMVRMGKARYIGFSNWPAWKVASALEFQRANGLAKFCHGQMYYSLIGRDIEGEYASMSDHYGLGLTVWSPLAMGFLTGKYTRKNVRDPSSRFVELGVIPLDSEAGFKAVDMMRPIAVAHKVSVAQVALAWLLSKPRVSSIIIGATQTSQLEENLRAADVTLTARELRDLDALASPTLPYPASHAWVGQDSRLAVALGQPVLKSSHE